MKTCCCKPYDAETKHIQYCFPRGLDMGHCFDQHHAVMNDPDAPEAVRTWCCGGHEEES